MRIELQNIAATADGLYEYEADKMLIFVPKNEIKKLSFGFAAPIRWPLISVLFGALFISGGIIFGAFPLIKAIIGGIGLPALKGYAYTFLNVFPGIYFVNLGLRKKTCLIVDTNKGIKKLMLEGPVEEHKAVNFLNETVKLFDYPI